MKTIRRIFSHVLACPILITLACYLPLKMAEAASFTPTGPMTAGRTRHSATLLADGKVLVSGGERVMGVRLATAEIYDPATGTWTATGPMFFGRDAHTATLLPNGKVLIAGGTGTGYPTNI